MVEAGVVENEWDLIQAGAVAPTEDVVADARGRKALHPRAVRSSDEGCRGCLQGNR